MLKKALIVIPARMKSTRLPDKPLALIRGKAMIQRVWEIAKQSQLASDVVIATDDEKLQNFCLKFGAKVVMTGSHHLTGTDRVAEAALIFPEYPILMSLQGDAVLTPPWVIDDLIKTLIEEKDVKMATPATRLIGMAKEIFLAEKEKKSSSGTCVVFDREKNALYFSKALIPYSRNLEQVVYRHIGLYAYERETLLTFSQMQESELEKSEGLEQLRALENGIDIRVVLVDYRGRTHGSVDRQEDIAFVESVIEKEGELV